MRLPSCLSYYRDGLRTRNKTHFCNNGSVTAIVETELIIRYDVMTLRTAAIKIFHFRKSTAFAVHYVKTLNEIPIEEILISPEGPQSNCCHHRTFIASTLKTIHTVLQIW